MSDPTILLSFGELAVRLHTTVTALYCRAHRDPKNLPPQVRIPGDRRVFFQESVVEEWMKNPQAFSNEESCCTCDTLKEVDHGQK